MYTPTANRPRDKNSGPLTVPVAASPPATAPVLSETAQLTADLKALDRAHEVSESALQALRSILRTFEQLKARWAVADQPATYDQIASEVLRLTTAMAVNRNVNLNMLADTLCEDIAALRPTAFIIARACSAHRGNSEFLSIAKLTEEIRRSSSAAEYYRGVIGRDLAKHIAMLEVRLREEAAYRAEEQARHLVRERKRVKGIFDEFDGAPPEDWSTVFGIPLDRATKYEADFSRKRRRTGRRGS